MEQLNATAVSTNFSPTELPTFPSWKAGGLVPAVVCIFCFLLGVPGNIAVILLKPNWQNLSSLSRTLMLNLAVSDLLCLVTLPIWAYSILYGWIFQLAACKLSAYLVYCSFHGSLLTVTALSVHRYLAVVRRQRYNQVRKRVLLLLLLWLVAVILSIPALVVRQLKTYQQSAQCRSRFTSETQGVVLMLLESLFGFVCFSLVGCTYIRLHRKVNQTALFNHPQTTRLVTSIIVSLFVVWIPYHTINLLRVAAICLKHVDLLNFCMDQRELVASLIFLHSCLNPLLYAFSSPKMCPICKQNAPHQGICQDTEQQQNLDDDS
ncbi:PREDICTED: C-X-C chemokine receptor type 2-like [Poecilia mexicana]|uniref:C-X-C chemokine receptor type 2-like n=1 Tax=Poecilia mexicana TaxID=48701 RepID=UPI00072E81AA|nr:PREDICTED: C-X-C chemokine receptor type 2-like [Poecilia mexicana]